LSKLDDIFYEEIWQASPHVCQCGCRAKLTAPWKRSYFHHLLPKQSYPAFRHIPENIMLLTPNCHDKAEKKVIKMPEVEKRTREAVKLLLK
jgi:5-methylcytosine-specific restriction endonuclease McrA